MSGGTAIHSQPDSLSQPGPDLAGLLTRAAPLVSQNRLYSITFEAAQASELSALAERAAQVANHIGLATGSPVSVRAEQRGDLGTIVVSLVARPEHHRWLCRRYPQARPNSPSTPTP